MKAANEDACLGLIEGVVLGVLEHVASEVGERPGWIGGWLGGGGEVVALFDSVGGIRVRFGVTAHVR